MCCSNYVRHTDGTKTYSTVNSISNSVHPIEASAVFKLETFPLTRMIANVSFDRTSFPQDAITVSDLVTFLKQQSYIETKDLITGFDGVHLILNFVNSSASAWTFYNANLRSGFIEFYGNFISLTSTASEERYIMKVHSTASNKFFIIYKLPNSNPKVYEVDCTLKS